jgi:hypothetical protein
MADLISGVRYFSSFKNKDSRGSLLKIIGHGKRGKKDFFKPDIRID